MANRYVIRTSPVFAFMDWVGQQLAIASKGSVWHDFSRRYLYVTNRQRLEIELLKNILETEAGQRNLETYLQSALHLTKDEVEVILFLDLSFSNLKASPTDTPSLPTPSSPRQISIIAYHTSKSGSPLDAIALWEHRLLIQLKMSYHPPDMIRFR